MGRSGGSSQRYAVLITVMVAVGLLFVLRGLSHSIGTHRLKASAIGLHDDASIGGGAVTSLFGQRKPPQPTPEPTENETDSSQASATTAAEGEAQPSATPAVPAHPSDTWEPFEKDGVWGYVDQNQHVVIEPHFEGAWHFQNARAAVQMNGKFGFINEDGQFIVQPEYDDIINFSQYSGIVAKDGRYAYVDPTGRPASDNTFDYAWPHNDDGVAMVKVDDHFGYVNARGEYIFPPNAQTTFGFSEGLAPVQVNDRFGYINTSGDYDVQPQFHYAWPFKNGEAMVENGGHFWFIDTRGNFIRDYNPNGK